MVASDYLVSLDTNRYSVPWRLIDATVEVLRVGEAWQIRHRGALITEHAALSGRHGLSVKPEHGPGAVARNARKRYAQSAILVANKPTPGERFSVVEQRDLAAYEQLLEAA
jgi:hypothetical protein